MLESGKRRTGCGCPFWKIALLFIGLIILLIVIVVLLWRSRNYCCTSQSHTYTNLCYNYNII